MPEQRLDTLETQVLRLEAAGGEEDSNGEWIEEL